MGRWISNRTGNIGWYPSSDFVPRDVLCLISARGNHSVGYKSGIPLSKIVMSEVIGVLWHTFYCNFCREYILGISLLISRIVISGFRCTTMDGRPLDKGDSDFCDISLSGPTQYSSHTRILFFEISKTFSKAGDPSSLVSVQWAGACDVVTEGDT